MTYTMQRPFRLKKTVVFYEFNSYFSGFPTMMFSLNLMKPTRIRMKQMMVSSNYRQMKTKEISLFVENITSFKLR